MSHSIVISDALYARIQQQAQPFVDLTPESVIIRWADHYDATHAPTAKKKASSAPADSVRKIPPHTPPDLTHTRCHGTFGKLPFRKWNDLIRTAHIQAYAKAKSFEALRSITHAQIRPGDQKGDSGYYYIPEIGLSLQGVDANHAWLYSLRLAQYLQTPLSATVEWRHNPKAAHPGESALLEWLP